MIPFMHEPKKIILVGDHMQLPATVMSENASKTKYSRSLFERFLECGIPNFMLNIQYRMEASIRQFSSDQFYGGRILDSQSIASRCMDSRLSDVARDLNFKQTMFFNLKFSAETQSEKSKTNPDEAQFI